MQSEVGQSNALLFGRPPVSAAVLNPRESLSILRGRERRNTGPSSSSKDASLTRRRHRCKSYRTHNGNYSFQERRFLATILSFVRT